MIRQKSNGHHTAVSHFRQSSIGWVICPELSDLFVSQIVRELCVSHFSGRILLYAYTFCRMVSFQFLAQFPEDLFPQPVDSSLVVFLITLLTIWLIVSSLSHHNLYLLFCCVLSIILSHNRSFRRCLVPCPSLIVWDFFTSIISVFVLAGGISLEFEYKSPEYLWEFLQIFAIMWSEDSRLFIWFPFPPIFFQHLLVLFQVHQLKLESPSYSCFTVFQFYLFALFLLKSVVHLNSKIH